MADARLETLSRILVDYSLDVQPGQLVTIGGSPLAAPLIRAVYRRVIERGGNPLLQISLPGISEIYYGLANDDQLNYIRPDEHIMPELADAALSILSDANTKALSGVDPSRQRLARLARADLTQTYLERSAAGALKWCVTLFPTEAFAQDAEMSLYDYEEFVYGAGLLDATDPVEEWQTVSREQARLVDWLSDKRSVHVTAPGTDLRLEIAGRTFMNADGRYNFPDGEIFTGPIENSVNGHVRFTFPCNVGGREVEDVQLWFEQGKVVKATAEKNEEYLLRTLDTDEGARYLGEFAFGTNRGITKFTSNILFDEKIGGTMHLALGSSYPETGGVNHSAIHWDMICDLRQQSEVHVDGQLFMKDGVFQV
ncbi:MAG TPA: aminopeptidase [Nitrolancea sp.]|nr:aminopeptidase [Nitrolancea sp.]